MSENLFYQYYPENQAVIKRSRLLYAVELIKKFDTASRLNDIDEGSSINGDLSHVKSLDLITRIRNCIDFVNKKHIPSSTRRPCHKIIFWCPCGRIGVCLYDGDDIKWCISCGYRCSTCMNESSFDCLCSDCCKTNSDAVCGTSTNE